MIVKKHQKGIKREIKATVKTRERKNVLSAMKSSDSSGQCANSKN